MIRLFKVLALLLMSHLAVAQCSSPCCCFSTLAATITPDEDICLPVGTPSVDRTISVTPSGGDTPYTYAWNSSPALPDPGNVSSALFTITETTVFTVTVTDFDDCIAVVTSTVTIDNAPDATLTANEADVCVACGISATIDLTAFEPVGATGQWFEGDQTGSCSSPSSPVANPSNVTLLLPEQQFTFGVVGTGNCTGQYDCDLITVYYNINLDLGELEVTGDVCDNPTINVTVTDTGTNPGNCVEDFLEWDNTSGINNSFTLISPTGVGETPIIDPGSGNTIGWQFPTGFLQGTTTTITIDADGDTDGDVCTNETFTIEIDGTACCNLCSGSIGFSGDASQSCEDLDFTITPSGCNGPYTWSYDGSGDLSETGSGSGLTGTITSSNELPDASGTYTITVTDVNGCTFTDDRSYSKCEYSSPEIISLTLNLPTTCDGSEVRIEYDLLTYAEACVISNGDDLEINYFLDGIEATNALIVLYPPSHQGDCSAISPGLFGDWDDPTITAGGTFELTLEMYNRTTSTLLDTYTFGNVVVGSCP